MRIFHVSITPDTAIRIATLAIWIGGAVCLAQPRVVVEDSFDYANATELAAGGWVTVAGTAAVSDSYFFAASSSGYMGDETQRPPTQEGFSLLRLGNAAVYRAMPTTETGDWRLTVAMAINAYQRNHNVGIADDDGNGYAIRWDSALPTNNAGRGALTIRKLSGWTSGTVSTGTQLGAAAASSQFATGFELPAGYSGSNPIVYTDPSDPEYVPGFGGFSTLVLTWTAATGLLTLSQFNPEDPAAMTTAIDTQYDTFTRIYLGGGNSGFYDSVTFESLPEPAAMGPGAAITGLMLSRRRVQR